MQFYSWTTGPSRVLRFIVEFLRVTFPLHGLQCCCCIKQDPVGFACCASYPECIRSCHGIPCWFCMHCLTCRSPVDASSLEIQMRSLYVF